MNPIAEAWVPGHGPLPSRLCLVGEAPGFNEMRERRPFVGKSGKELDAYLERAGLQRALIYVTNLCKTQPPMLRGKQSAPTREMIEAWTPEIVEELAAARPRWIGAVGRVAARWLAEIGDMESAHGMAFPLAPRLRDTLRSEAVVAARVARALVGAPPTVIEAFSDPDSDEWIDECRVVPLYHPAAALHNPELQPYVWSDIRTFSAYALGRLQPHTPIDEYPSPRYALGLRGWPRRVEVVGVDTEGSASAPWSVQLSYRAGAARVVRYTNAFAQRASIQRILSTAGRVVFQNALHDEAVLAAMGITLDWSRVDDTFVAADVLRLTPRGLKAGARRDCGMEMRGYAEVVAPAEKRLAREYVEAAIRARECPDCGGSGEVIDAEATAERVAKALLGKRYKQETVYRKCGRCVDGGLWEARTAEAVWDDAVGVWKVKSGWEVQRYLRTLKADIEKGKYDAAADDEEAEGEEAESPRSRFENWPEEVRQQITGALGHGMPEPTLSDVPLAEAVAYGCRDADAVYRRHPILMSQIRELDLDAAYRLDVDVLPVAAEIQRNGMHIDRRHFAELVDELRERKENVAQQLESHIGRRLNPASGDQVAELLYGRMRLDYTDEDERELGSAVRSFDLVPEKWTASRKRGSADEKTLEGLKLKYALRQDLVTAIDLILDWRMCNKIETTYAIPLPLYADAHDRVHTRIKIGPATFRWACASPPLHQIPTREKHGEDLGRRVRAGFTAPEGRVMGARDFDQIEVRILAWYSQDETLLRIFRDGPTCPHALDPAHPLHYKGKCRCHDPHFITGHRVFKTPLERVTKAQRDSSKNIKFGVMYGISAKALKAQMDLRGIHWTLDECQALIDNYKYEAYPGVGAWIADAEAEARRTCTVRTPVGHIRYCPAVHSPDRGIREAALREAVNFKVQAFAAELMKLAERDVWTECGERLRELEALIVMSVHDELVVEAPEAVVGEIDALMGAYMRNPWPMDGMEITSGSKWGRSWAETK